MSNRDWDKARRQSSVASHGGERSEFPDMAQQYAKAKGMAKVRGLTEHKCPFCDGYFEEGAEGEHRHVWCRPKPRTNRSKPRQFKKPTLPIHPHLVAIKRDPTGQVIERIQLY